MFEILEAIKDSAHGIVILGALGSILALAVVKLALYFAKKAVPEFYRDWVAIVNLCRKTIKSGNKTDSIFLLVLTSTFSIASFITLVSSGILIQIFKTRGDVSDYFMIQSHVLVFLSAMATIKGVFVIFELIAGVCKKHELNFDGVLDKEE